MTPFPSGSLVISLDFELNWGVRDSRPGGDYRANLLGVRQAVPALLDLFARYGIHATWATVGLLFCRSREEMLEAAPSIRPQYDNARLSPYSAIDTIGAAASKTVNDALVASSVYEPFAKNRTL